MTCLKRAMMENPDMDPKALVLFHCPHEYEFPGSCPKWAESAALDALADMTCSGPEDFFSRFAGMQVLIERLQSTIPDGVPEPEEPVQEPPKKEEAFKGYSARMKRELHAKLREYREKGISMSKIAEASNGFLTTTDLYSMLNAEKMPMTKWDLLQAAFAEMEGSNA